MTRGYKQVLLQHTQQQQKKKAFALPNCQTGIDRQTPSGEAGRGVCTCVCMCVCVYVCMCVCGRTQKRHSRLHEEFHKAVAYCTHISWVDKTGANKIEQSRWRASPRARANLYSAPSRSITQVLGCVFHKCIYNTKS